MNLEWSSADLAFRDQVRDFFENNLTEEIKNAGRWMTSVYADPEISLKWQRILAKKGWAVPSWPVEYGGCDWSVLQHYIFARERVRAGAPPLSPMGLKMVAPAILKFGTDQQKSFYLSRMLSGEHFWCQGYSEYESGSDLASLQMTAIEDGSSLICSGTKVWTTHAHVANWIFCLVRTSKHERKQDGITFLLIDMNSPGISIRPFIMLSGEHIQNEVSFDQVRVPKSYILGEMDKGWSVAKYLLQFERGGSAYAPLLKVRLEELYALSGTGQDNCGDSLKADPAFSAKLANAVMRVEALEYYELQVMSAISQDQPVGGAASTIKVLGTELAQLVTELFVEAAAYHGIPFQPHQTAPGGPVSDYIPANSDFAAGAAWQAAAPLRYFNERAGSIYAGTNEIQRNILAKLELGL